MLLELVLVSFGVATFVSGISSHYYLLTITGIVLYIIGVVLASIKDEKREQRLQYIEDSQDELLANLFNVLYAILKDECDKTDVPAEKEDTHDKKS